MQFVTLSKLNTVNGWRVFVGRVNSVANFGSSSTSSSASSLVRSGAASSYCTYRRYRNTISSAPGVSSPLLGRGRMVGTGTKSVGGDVSVDGVVLGYGSNVVEGRKGGVVFFGNRSVVNCRKGRVSLRSKDGGCSFRCMAVPDLSWKVYESRPFVRTCVRDLHTSSSASYTDGNVGDGSVEVAARDETSGKSDESAKRNHVDQRTLKLLSGSFYLPHPDKAATGGEDAHFICEEEGVIGVADGVGGWADVGVDAGLYARGLMSNSVSAIKEDPKGPVDPAKVLEKAHSDTNIMGSSTACIVALTDQGIHAINLGDSGFLVIRDGSTVFRSPSQQYGFNCPYQLANGSGADSPSSGQVFAFPVEAGDVIVAGTDGLFDNLYDNEITALVVQAMRSGLAPKVTAQNIATLAQQRALDRHRQSPFAAAAHDAGYRYFGGKLDDITVVVSYIRGADSK